MEINCLFYHLHKHEQYHLFLNKINGLFNPTAMTIILVLREEEGMTILCKNL
jgi:hypothetical protein